jgi:hypothetical protein
MPLLYIVWLWYILWLFRKFYVHLVYFKVIWYALFSIFCSQLVYFPPIWYVVPRKIWQPCHESTFAHKAQQVTNLVCVFIFFDLLNISFFVTKVKLVDTYVYNNVRM